MKPMHAHRRRSHIHILLKFGKSLLFLLLTSGCLVFVVGLVVLCLNFYSGGFFYIKKFRISDLWA